MRGGPFPLISLTVLLTKCICTLANSWPLCRPVPPICAGRQHFLSAMNMRRYAVMAVKRVFTPNPLSLSPYWHRVWPPPEQYQDVPYVPLPTPSGLYSARGQLRRDGAK